MKSSLPFILLLSLSACTAPQNLPPVIQGAQPAPATNGSARQIVPSAQATARPPAVEPPAASVASPTVAAPSTNAQQLTLNLTSDRTAFIAVGQQAQLSVSAKNAAGAAVSLSQKISWSSSDPKIFTVGADGKVIAKAQTGTAKIMASIPELGLSSDISLSIAPPVSPSTAPGSGGGGGGGGGSAEVSTPTAVTPADTPALTPTEIPGDASPNITWISDASGAPGSNVLIIGKKFTGTTGVSFNGAAATFSVQSDTQILAAIPAAATDGFISVTTANGTATLNHRFDVIP